MQPRNDTAQPSRAKAGRQEGSSTDPQTEGKGSWGGVRAGWAECAHLLAGPLDWRRVIVRLVLVPKLYAFLI